MGTDVVFRAERIVPHVSVADRDTTHARASAAATERASDRRDAIEEIDQRPGTPGSPDSLADRLAAARARWSQLTFYLLDAESWR